MDLSRHAQCYVIQFLCVKGTDLAVIYSQMKHV
jgi:hypothetical protein